MTPSRIEDLIAGFLDGRATAAELAELQALLEKDPAAVRQLVETVEIDSLLADRLSDRAERMQIAELLVSRSIVAPVAPSEVPVSVATPPRVPVLGFLASISRNVPGGEFTVGSLLILVVVAAFWGLSQAILYPRLGDTNLVASSSPNVAGDNAGENEAVAAIRNTTDARWSPASGSSARNLNSEVALGEPLQLASGLVELQLKHGVTLLVEGPAEWTIDGKNHASLKQGRMFARVPERAIGFTLETPHAKIIDLGTEFAAEVSPDGEAAVHVVHGLVNVQSSAASGAAQSDKLRAGQSMRITTGGNALRDQVSDIPDKFKHLLAAQERDSQDTDFGPPSGLVSYYPFEGDTRDHAMVFAANSGNANDDLKLFGKGEFLEGRVGRALRLDGGYLSAPFSTDLNLPTTFTIEAWIVAERLTNDYQRCFLCWGPSATKYHFSIFKDGMELGIGQADGKLIRAAGGELKIERWQHVAGVSDGIKLRVYINGEEIASRDFDGTLMANQSEGLGVGDSAAGDLPPIRLHGAIDELAIWDIALSPEQIAAHSQRGTHGYQLSVQPGTKN